MELNRRVRVRFAPSPTGPLHIGGIRTALYNYLFAKKYNGDFILRVEDTDQNRLVQGAEQYIIDSLKWVGLEPNEGAGFGEGEFSPYRQSERKDSYRQYAETLLAKGHAYYAFDTEEELAQLKLLNSNFKYDGTSRQSLNNSLSLTPEKVQEKLVNNEHYVVRLKVPVGEEVIFHDEIRGNISVSTNEMDDKVLLKSDGMPTYHLANVCDDYVMKISHVIRGEEWLPSAPSHVLLYRFMGWEDVMPKFAHLPLLLKPDGNGKLSKRDGDRLGFPVFPLEWTDPVTKDKSSGYKQQGYLPGAVINFLAFLGWNPGGTKEIYTLEELTEAFTIERISHGGAKFDFEKAKWFNAEYIKHLDGDALASLVKQGIEDKFGVQEPSFLNAACGMIKDRLVFLNDLGDHYSYIFKSPGNYTEANLSKVKSIKEGLNIMSLVHSINNISAFTSMEIENEFKNFVATHDLKFGDLMKFIRLSLVGEFSGPSVPELIQLLGKEITIERLKDCYSQI